jgi:pantoate kinase
VTIAVAFSPCNITGFFRIHTDPAHPLRAGSTGASVALSTGVTTRVSVKRARKSIVSARFNGRLLARNSVSAYVARKCIELDGSRWRIDIDHKSRLPTGCGYGTSGAGALSLAFALNDAMGSSLTKVEAAQLAHVSEIACKTGLGTVNSVFSGGLVLRVAPGAPGVARITKLSAPRKLLLVTATFGPISTSTVLGNDLLRHRVNLCGKQLIENFDAAHLQSSFMELSRKFCNCLNLMSDRLARVIGRLESSGFKSSMVMLGESLFCMADGQDAHEIGAIIQDSSLNPIVSAVAGSGAHLV